MNNIKRTIRLQRAQLKLDKRVYPRDKTEKGTIRLIERKDQLEKDIQNTWNVMFSNGYRAGIDNQNPAFFKDFDFINATMKEKEQLVKKIDFRLKKLNTSEDKLMYNYNRLNTGRGSTSF